jgi:signal recognition particle receptor subunit beta
MVFFNWATMQMAAKIVYYGPGLCGKTSNLSYIYAKTSPNSRGEMVSLETESERTLFFDLLPIEVGTIGGFKTRLQLYTVPGQVFYNTTRKLVLKGVDGLVFVADSQRPMRDANIESFNSLIDNLKEFGLELSDVPIVLQFNKRDLNNVLSIEELNADLNPDGVFPYYEASAINGDGVITTLKEITKITLKQLRAKMAAPDSASQKSTVPAPTVRPVKAPKPAQPISANSLLSAAQQGVGVEPQAEEVPPESPPIIEAPSESEPAPPPEAAAAPEDFELPPPAPPEPEATAAPEPELEPEAEAEPKPLPDPEPQPVEETFEELAPPPPPPPDFDLPPAAEDESPPLKIDSAPSSEPIFAADRDEIEVEVEEQDDDDLVAEVDLEPPPVKRVHVSNQMDILAELDSLRKLATMANGEPPSVPSEPRPDHEARAEEQIRELSRNVEKALNSDIFKNMRGMQLAIRIQNESGETIHTLDPVSLDVEDATALKRLRLRFGLDLENIR